MSTDPIVAGTDGSATAARALDKAGELAQALGATVHVVSCHEVPSAASRSATTGGVPMPELDEDPRANAQEIVEREAQRLGERGVETRTHVYGGDPAKGLMAIAADEAAQMIVVGNRGMTGARRVLGSVPNSVSHHATCSVLIVPTR
jgi:nucleotide-binding universal stress UspA family protein